MSLYLVLMVAAIIVGLVTRGNLIHLPHLQIKYWGLLSVRILMRFPMMYCETFSQLTAGWLGAGLQIGGLLTILIFTVLNRRMNGI